jgi:hypothetical protein
MEDNVKKTLLIVISVACIAAAGVMMYKTMGGGATSGEPAGKIWVKCESTKCNNEYQLSAKDYSDFIMDNGGHRQIMMAGMPPMKCPKCGEKTAFKAEKCEKCGKVFFFGSVEGKAEDTCPGCGYSKAEAEAKQAAQDANK